MDAPSAKEYLHEDLRWVREAMVWKVDGLSEYDARRPLTLTGTNLLGLIKHLAVSESWYLGEIFGRPFPQPLPRWDEPAVAERTMYAAAHETREEIIGLYRRVWQHSDATIAASALDAPGHVPWWPRPDVTLFKILIHVLTETNRHAGHADILREQLDGATGQASDLPGPQRDAAFWEARRAKIEQAARAASDRPPHGGPAA